MRGPYQPDALRVAPEGVDRGHLGRVDLLPDAGRGAEVGQAALGVIPAPVEDDARLPLTDEIGELAHRVHAEIVRPPGTGARLVGRVYLARTTWTVSPSHTRFASALLQTDAQGSRRTPPTSCGSRKPASRGSTRSRTATRASRNAESRHSRRRPPRVPGGGRLPRRAHGLDALRRDPRRAVPLRVPHRARRKLHGRGIHHPRDCRRWHAPADPRAGLVRRTGCGRGGGVTRRGAVARYSSYIEARLEARAVVLSGARALRNRRALRDRCEDRLRGRGRLAAGRADLRAHSRRDDEGEDGTDHEHFSLHCFSIRPWGDADQAADRTNSWCPTESDTGLSAASSPRDEQLVSDWSRTPF